MASHELLSELSLILHAAGQTVDFFFLFFNIHFPQSLSDYQQLPL